MLLEILQEGASRQDKRRFVKRVNYITTSGYLDGPGLREIDPAGMVIGK